MAFGILKARSDVAIPSLISFAGYWGIGFGLMTVLAGSMGLGAVGIWAALAGGTTASAAGLWIYLWRRDAAHFAARPGRVTGSQLPASSRLSTASCMR